MSALPWQCAIYSRARCAAGDAVARDFARARASSPNYLVRGVGNSPSSLRFERSCTETGFVERPLTTPPFRAVPSPPRTAQNQQCAHDTSAMRSNLAARCSCGLWLRDRALASLCSDACPSQRTRHLPHPRECACRKSNGPPERRLTLTPRRPRRFDACERPPTRGLGGVGAHSPTPPSPHVHACAHVGFGAIDPYACALRYK